MKYFSTFERRPLARRNRYSFDDRTDFQKNVFIVRRRILISIVIKHSRILMGDMEDSSMNVWKVVDLRK